MERRRASRRAGAPAQAQLWGQLRDLHPLEGAAVLLVAGFQLQPAAVGTVLGVSERCVGLLCDRGFAKLWAQRGGKAIAWEA